MVALLTFFCMYCIYIVYVMYKPWPRGVYVRYTPAVRNLFVIFPEGQRPEGYITNKLPNIAGVYLKLDYGNFKLTNQVARNAGSIFHSHLVSGIYSWPLAPSTGIYLHACC